SRRKEGQDGPGYGPRQEIPGEHGAARAHRRHRERDAEFPSRGQFGQSPPPFKEGDRAWTGAPIAEIPDMSELQVEFRIEEVDRGLLQIGQPVRVTIDAVPDLQIGSTLDWISPIAQLLFRSFPPEKNF